MRQALNFFDLGRVAAEPLIEIASKGHGADTDESREEEPLAPHHPFLVGRRDPSGIRAALIG